MTCRPEEIRESDIGTGAGLFEVQKIGDEFFTFIIGCEDPKACTILLRGASKDVLNEVQANSYHSTNTPERHGSRCTAVMPAFGNPCLPLESKGSVPSLPESKIRCFSGLFSAFPKTYMQLSPDRLVQVERNLQDAMGVARNVCFDPRLVPGGGAVEMAVSHSLSGRADNIQVTFPFLSKMLGDSQALQPAMMLTPAKCPLCPYNHKTSAVWPPQ